MLSRPPTAEESRSALALLDSLEKTSQTELEHLPAALKKLPAARRRALAKLCLALFNLNEFAFVD